MKQVLPYIPLPIEEATEVQRCKAVYVCEPEVPFSSVWLPSLRSPFILSEPHKPGGKWAKVTCRERKDLNPVLSALSPVGEAAAF